MHPGDAPERYSIRQPLSELALEILKESMGNYDYAFTGRFGDAPLSRQAMSKRCAVANADAVDTLAPLPMTAWTKAVVSVAIVIALLANAVLFPTW